MNEQHLLGQLHGLHDMLSQLVGSIPEADAYHRFHPRLAPLAWYFGRSMYLETYWLREVVQRQADMTERVREISGYGRVWEWCANLFEPYTDYQAPQLPEARTREFDQQHHSLRGASLHTQRPLKRPTYRNRAKPDEGQLFTGTRLVFPPD